ncbi:twin-arginine translocase subunit TatC [Paenibacillus pinistramenti]|uniref:twin-arginine translocase subunit TatC n=1 Tax=Paenibacillus pinistramenti TaxID=1768003 RepID=UPI001EEFDEB7|nr:twin-arginine translocase subunit TatC [Paenibacillus pinistramenti]
MTEPTEPSQPVRSQTMSMTSHLAELRRRLLAVFLVFGLVVVGGFFAAEPVYHYLTAEGSGGSYVQLNAFSFWDGVSIYMKIALTLAFGITLPFTLYQLWAFVKPGLKPEERRATLKYIPFAFLSFAGGTAFAYYVVFPLALHFTSSLNRELGLVETYGAADYFRFLTNIVVPVSLVFELPLVVLFLTHLRLVNPVKLRKMRKIAYFALVVASAAITPPDLLSAFLVLVPLLLLYELSILLSGRVYRKQNKQE